MTAAHVTMLDPGKIRAARTRLGLGSYVVARALGVSTAVIDRLEEGSNQSNISVSFVTELAAILGADIADLLAERPDRRPPDEPDLIEADDLETVGAVAAGNGGVVAVDAVALGLGWSLQRTLLALDELTVRLPAVGQRLAWVTSTRVAVRAAVIDDRCARTVGLRGFADTGLRRDEAQLVYRVLSNQSMSTTTSNPVAVQRLLASGLLDYADSNTPGRANHAVLSDDCKFNLVV